MMMMKRAASILLATYGLLGCQSETSLDGQFSATLMLDVPHELTSPTETWPAFVWWVDVDGTRHHAFERAGEVTRDGAQLSVLPTPSSALLGGKYGIGLPFAASAAYASTPITLDSILEGEGVVLATTGNALLIYSAPTADAVEPSDATSDHYKPWFLALRDVPDGFSCWNPMFTGRRECGQAYENGEPVGEEICTDDTAITLERIECDDLRMTVGDDLPEVR